jgi:glycosyltransferase involved in cell wall biosynthesis
MKIAYLAHEYPKVTHTFIRREIKGVERRGFQVERIALWRPRLDELPDAEDQEEFHRTFGVMDRRAGLLIDVGLVALQHPWNWLRTVYRAARLGFHSHRGLLHHLAYFVEACAIFRHARKRGVDHVHAHFGMSVTMVAMLLQELGGPSYSFQIHGPGEWDAPGLLHIPEKVAKAAFATAISDFARGQTWRWTPPEHWDKVHVVRCGVDERFIEQEVVPVPDVPRFLHVGRMGRSKAQPLILRAAARLKAMDRAFEIVIIGDGELREYLESLIAELDIADVIRLVGWTTGEGVREELLRSRALLLPSFGEGLPVIIMEALAVARPVITTRIAGIGELVVGGENGWLISSGNPDQIVEAMLEALDTPAEKLTEMGLKGREAVRAMHDSHAEAGKLADLFATLQ